MDATNCICRGIFGVFDVPLVCPQNLDDILVAKNSLVLGNCNLQVNMFAACFCLFVLLLAEFDSGGEARSSSGFGRNRCGFGLLSLFTKLQQSVQGWKPVGGDPCLELWQGVACVFSNVTAMLVLDGDSLPVVVPFVHTGMQEIMPIGASFPRIGKMGSGR